MEAELKTLWFDALANFGASKGMPVAFPNVDFDKPTGEDAKFLRAVALPTDPTAVNVCGEFRYRWVLQVSILVRDGIGELGAAEIADQLKSVFPANSALVGSTRSYAVLKPPAPAAPIALDGWYSVPVSLTVQAFD